jgi:hypothetical protein
MCQGNSPILIYFDNMNLGVTARELVERFTEYWRRQVIARRELQTLDACGREEEAKLARDLGLSLVDLRKLMRTVPAGTTLLLRRMAALDLDPKEVSEIEPLLFRDLERVCTLCGSRRRCSRDLAHNSADPAWESYCPNVATLKILDALPWAARREW